MSNFKHEYVLLEGHRLAFLDEGDGPPILLIHGIPTSSMLWRNVIPALSASHRVIAPDMLNYGMSDKPTDADVSIVAQARLMIGLLDALGIRRADVLAHDIGGGVAQIIAVRHGERINRLILSNAVCFDSWPIPEFEPLQKPNAEARMSLQEFVDMMRSFLPQGAYRPEAFSPEIIDIIMQPWSSDDGKRALFRNIRRLNSEYTLAIADELKQVEHETLLLWGRDDPFQKAVYAKKLQNIIRNSELTWIDEAGHWVMEEKTAELTTAVAAFVRKD